jgi:hypothetical protein
VRREALDRKRPSYPDLPVVLIGLVVEVLELGLGGDGSVDLFLTCGARLPPVGVQFLGGIGPGGISFARDFPFLPGLVERGVE